MAMVASSNMSGPMQKQLTRSLERILEEAHLSGELRLSGRKLKDFPKVGKSGPATSSKFNLRDTVIADLSKNRFMELPEEVTEFPFLEKLQLYHNAIKAIPETVGMLLSLNYLDLSRNQLQTLPREICNLSSLQILLVAHNRLKSLPEDLARLKQLAELDAGCNEIKTLPPRMNELKELKLLDLRNNLLEQIPIELTYLNLVRLDISGNRIKELPPELREMVDLAELRLSDNPLTSPPASLCIRGRTHIFKYLERQAPKHEKSRGGKARRGPIDALRGGHATLDSRLHRRHNVDSGYSTSDGYDKRWSQEIQTATLDGEPRPAWRQGCSPLSITLPHDISLNGSCGSGTSTPSTISPGDNTSLEDELGKAMKLQDRLERKTLERSASANGTDSKSQLLTNARHTSITPPGHLESMSLSIPTSHTTTHPVQPLQTTNSSIASQINGDKIQTYKEYKEAQKRQRANEMTNIYRNRGQATPTGTESGNSETDSTSSSGLSSKQIFSEDGTTKRPVLKVTPSRIGYNSSLGSSGAANGCDENHTARNGNTFTEQTYRKPSSPVKTSSSIFSAHSSPGRVMPRVVKTAQGYVEGNESPKAVRWNNSDIHLSDKFTTFTMRREFEKAKEEADLIEQLRSNIETRLKMALPEDLAPALTDGVVLCHLVNHVRPRSVSSIHVPSPANPHLPIPRCRKNVENFLEACRAIGVDEEVLLDTDAIMDVGYMDAYGLEALGQLVSRLVSLERRIEDPGPTSQTVQDRLVSAMLFAAFVATLALLYAFPIPD